MIFFPSLKWNTARSSMWTLIWSMVPSQSFSSKVRGMAGSEFTAFSFIPYSYHCILLIVTYRISIIVGFGKKFEEDEDI